MGSENFYMRDCFYGVVDNSKPMEDLKKLLGSPRPNIIWKEFGMDDMDGGNIVGVGILMGSRR